MKYGIVSPSARPLTSFPLVDLEKELGILTKCKGKGKGKIHPRTGHEGPEGE